MSDEMLDAYIRQLIEAHRVPEVTVAWQGGEPTLMGLDFFRRSIELEKKYCKPGMTIQNTIQTNGTLINDDWAKFFKDNNFLVGLSIDGPREMHDFYRVGKQGEPTFDRVMRGLDFLQKHQVEWNALTTIHHANGDHPVEVYRFLRDDCKAQFIQLIPIVERKYDMTGTPAGVTERSVTAEQYGKFLVGVFEEWVRRDVATVYVQMFDVALANWFGEPSGLCVHSKTCGGALAIEHNGDLYSCDHFVEPKYKLGNISQKHMLQLVASDQQLKFGQDKYDTLPKYCRECEVLFACHGGCPKDRFILTPDGEAGLNYLCPGYKIFFNHVNKPMQIMTELLDRNLAPAEIMKTYTKTIS
jgi:uncharacterized protein